MFCRTAIVALAAWAACLASSSSAGIVSAGSPSFTVPTSLYDPLSSFATSPLQSNQFLLPIQITGASGLQDWSFDIAFNDDVVKPLDILGLYQSVYQAEFSATDATLSNVTSSGLLLPDLLQNIAGFSSGVSGDGVLAFVLFQFEPGQETNDPNFVIANPLATEQLPEPGTLALLIVVVAALQVRRLIACRGTLRRVH